MENSELRDRLGLLDISDESRCHIRHFSDRYTNDTEFRWRIFVPDASRYQIYYSTGVLPNEGIPDNSQGILPVRLAKGPADLVLIVENRNGHRPGEHDFRIGLQTEFQGDSSAPKLSTTKLSAEWMPWFRDEECVYENPPFDETTSFDTTDSFVIMKHYVENSDGQKTGYMVWIAPHDGLGLR